MSKEIYDQACQSLEADNLATVVDLGKSRQGGAKLTALVKKPPHEVVDILRANPGLCSIEMYRMEYNSVLPIKVNSMIRRKLVALGYVTEKQVEYQLKQVEYIK